MVYTISSEQSILHPSMNLKPLNLHCLNTKLLQTWPSNSQLSWPYLKIPAKFVMRHSLISTTSGSMTIWWDSNTYQAWIIFMFNIVLNSLIMFFSGQVVSKWFALQSSSDIPGNVANVQKLLEHPAFDLRNPNKACYKFIFTHLFQNPSFS